MKVYTKNKWASWWVVGAGAVGGRSGCGGCGIGHIRRQVRPPIPWSGIYQSVISIDGLIHTVRDRSSPRPYHTIPDHTVSSLSIPPTPTDEGSQWLWAAWRETMWAWADRENIDKTRQIKSPLYLGHCSMETYFHAFYSRPSGINRTADQGEKRTVHVRGHPGSHS